MLSYYLIVVLIIFLVLSYFAFFLGIRFYKEKASFSFQERKKHLLIGAVLLAFVCFLSVPVLFSKVPDKPEIDRFNRQILEAALSKEKGGSYDVDVECSLCNTGVSVYCAPYKAEDMEKIERRKNGELGTEEEREVHEDGSVTSTKTFSSVDELSNYINSQMGTMGDKDKGLCMNIRVSSKGDSPLFFLKDEKIKDLSAAEFAKKVFFLNSLSFVLAFNLFLLFYDPSKKDEPSKNEEEEKSLA